MHILTLTFTYRPGVVAAMTVYSGEVKALGGTLTGVQLLHVQWSLYFKTTHTNKIWFYIAGGLKIKSFNTENCTLGPNQVVL